MILFHAHDADTARSAATRAAIESVVFAPPCVLPGRGVSWRAETENVIVGRFGLPPERPEVRVRIDEHGAIRTVSALRWGNAGEKTFQYIPFGGDVHAERRFGDPVLPTTLSVGNRTWDRCRVTTFGTGTPSSAAADPEATAAAVDLYWLPLGAGGHVVRLNGRVVRGGGGVGCAATGVRPVPLGA